jgi:hypothetical protein
LLTLDEAGVTSLGTAYASQTTIDAQGNKHLQSGQYVASDGETRAMDDVWFAVDTAYTLDTHPVQISDAIAALPDLTGFGNVHDLRQAMARDESGRLQDLVESYIAEIDPTVRNAILPPLIYAWAGVETIDPNDTAIRQHYGTAIGDARKLIALETFLGESFRGGGAPAGTTAATNLLEAFDKLSGYVAAHLLAKTQLKPLFNTVTLGWNEKTASLGFDVTATVTALRALYEAEPTSGLSRLKEFGQALEYFGEYGALVSETLRQKGSFTGSEFDFHLAILGRIPTFGDAGNNTLQGQNGDDVLFGMAGNDTLNGGTGDDLLEGGSGDDSLSGGAGDDTFVFRAGDGQDIVYDTAGSDILCFAGANLADIRFIRTGTYDLAIAHGEGDRVTLQKHFHSATYQIESIELADGSLYALSDLL